MKPGKPFEIKAFSHEPGIYYEKIGRLHPIESTWKLVITTDIRTISGRLTQLENYIQQTEKICKIITFDTSLAQACQTLNEITRKETELEKNNKKHKYCLSRPDRQKEGTDRRIRRHSKNIDRCNRDDDEKHINKQMTLLQNNQDTLRHTIQTQTKIINATIAQR